MAEINARNAFVAKNTLRLRELRLGQGSRRPRGKFLPHGTSTEIAASLARCRLVLRQGERDVRYRSPHHAGRLPFEGPRAQSAAGQEEVPRRLTKRSIQGAFRHGADRRPVSGIRLQPDGRTLHDEERRGQRRRAISTDAMDALEGSARTPPQTSANSSSVAVGPDRTRAAQKLRLSSWRVTLRA